MGLTASPERRTGDQRDQLNLAFDAIIDGDTLKAAGDATGKKVVTAGPFTKEGKGVDMSGAEVFARTAFSLPLNEISDIKEIQGCYYIIEPIEKIAPSVLAFDKVQNKVKRDLIAELQKEKAKKDAETILTELKKSGDLEKVAVEKGLEVKLSKLFTRDEGIGEVSGNRKITKEAFKLSGKNRICPNLVKANGNFFIIVFRERKIPAKAEIDKNISAVKTKLIKVKRTKVFQAFLDDLRTRSTIKIEPGVID
jgi:hypothetical protein